MISSHSDQVADAVNDINRTHDIGLPAGVAGHSPRVFQWAETFVFAACHLRESDAVCVGIYDENHPKMLAEDVRIFQESLAAVSR